MRFPNKVTSYKESIFFTLCPILDLLSKKDMSIYDVYNETSSNYASVTDFIDAIDCLFALNKILYFEKSEVLHYVA